MSTSYSRISQSNKFNFFGGANWFPASSVGLNISVPIFDGKADYIKNTSDFVWKRVLESAAAADTVLKMEKQLSRQFPSDQKFSFEERNGVVVRQYSSSFSIAYNRLLKGMIERRMRQSIFAVASFWFTAWVDAGQPDLMTLTNREFCAEDLKEFEELNIGWKDRGTQEDH